MDPIVSGVLEVALQAAREDLREQDAAIERAKRELETRMGFRSRALDRMVAIQEALRDAGA
jgi:uncharacterized protein YajQ (UPF0234 family)